MSNGTGVSKIKKNKNQIKWHVISVSNGKTKINQTKNHGTGVSTKLHYQEVKCIFIRRCKRLLITHKARYTLPLMSPNNSPG